MAAKSSKATRQNAQWSRWRQETRRRAERPFGYELGEARAILWELIITVLPFLSQLWSDVYPGPLAGAFPEKLAQTSARLVQLGLGIADGATH